LTGNCKGLRGSRPNEWIDMFFISAGAVSDDGYPSERRRHRRIDMELPIEILLVGSGIPAIGSTKNVSAGGVKFFVSQRLQQNSEIEFILSLPPEITLCETMRVKCRGRLLRVLRDGELGSVAVASIQNYEFISIAMTSPPW